MFRVTLNLGHLWEYRGLLARLGLLQPVRTRESQLSDLSPCRMDFAHMYQVYKSRRGIKRSEDSKVGASLGTSFLSPSRALSFQEKFACLKVGWGGGFKMR